MKDKISVVIPIHNSEKYLAECLDSVLSQTYSNIEVILIENLSTDLSMEICKEYTRKDDRVKLFIENKPGAAAARNCGIKNATGEYITFVDSDDFLERQAYEIIMGKMNIYNSDLACYSFNYVDENKDIIKWYTPRLSKYNMKKKVYTGKETAAIFLQSKDIEGFGWNKVFKRDVFINNNILFEENKTAYEDMAILFDAISYCKRVIFINSKLYNYRQIETSLTHFDYNNKEREYNDSIEHIALTAKRMKLIKELNVFLVSRKIISLYNKSDCREINNYKCQNGTKKFIYELWMILKNYKSEKIKTIAKAIRIRLQSK